MKKKIAILLALLLLCFCTIAYAADPVTLDITALDYQTGKAVSKTYVNNELFLLKVDLGIPRFFDLTDMELIIELDGVKLDTNDLKLEAGTYYLSGIVTDQPAALRITKTGGASVLAYAVSIALIGFGFAVAGRRK